MVRERRHYLSGGYELPYDYFPPPRAGAPLVVCIHGGGWISGEPEGMHDVAERLQAMGYAAATPAYRLAPLHPFPAAVSDVRTFLGQIRAQAAVLGFDPSRVGALGNSAGGHLAAMCGSDGIAPSSKANAVVAICPITNVTDHRVRHFPISYSFLEQFMGVPPEGNEGVYREASPVFGVGPGSPPHLLIHGTADDIVPVGQTDELERALMEQGVRVRKRILEGEGHSFSFGGWAEIEREFDAFFGEELGPVG